ncbi:MAG TPA: YHS domain-containing protein, partial [Nitrospiraceae bacterium]|nr:YHS domain-containing protein [Nitrospiraceae bacterium]
MAIDPICGMTVDQATAAGRHDYEGQTFWFCSRHCLEKFAANPARYAKSAAVVEGQQPRGRKPLPMMIQTSKPVEPTTDQPGQIDPVCGMTVQPDSAAGSHRHNGKTYYFCSRGCLAKFQAMPEKYLASASQTGQMHEQAPIMISRPLPMAPAQASTPDASAEIDPVCGMSVQRHTAAGSHDYQG